MLHETFVDLAKHHLCHFHRLRVGHTQSVDELRFHSDFADPFADLFSAAVHNDRFKPNQFQKSDVFDHPFFQFLVHHRAAAVFYDDDLPVKSLDVRKRLDQYFRLIQILLHIFIHSIPFLSRF